LADARAWRRSAKRPSVDFHSSSEFLTGNPRRPAGFPAGQTTLPLLDFSCPTTQSQAGGFVSRQRIPPPPGATFEVWVPPARLLHPALPTLAHRSVHGLPPSRTSPRSNRYPSRGPCPPALTRSPRRSKSATVPRSRLQGLVPAASPFRHQGPYRPRPPIPSWDSTLQSVLPSNLALALCRDASPLALRRIDVQVHLGLRVLRYEWVGRSVSGSPTLLGFSTFRRSQRPVHRSSGRAYGFASRTPTRSHASGQQSLTRESTLPTASVLQSIEVLGNRVGCLAAAALRLS
jgi:hypothetical protein